MSYEEWMEERANSYVVDDSKEGEDEDEPRCES